MSITWSKYQEPIFDAVANTNDSLIIEACAGSGKTTTIVECVRRVPADKSVVFLAFNKVIQQTLAGRVTSPNATCATLHSMGLRAWKRFIGEAGGSLRVDGRKLWEIAREVMTYDERRRFGQVVKLAGLGKQVGIVPRDTQKLTGSFMSASDGGGCRGIAGGRGERSSGVAKLNTGNGAISLSDLPDVDSLSDSALAHGLVDDCDGNWRDLMTEYDVDEDEVSLTLVRRLLSESIRKSLEVIDFDDMLYLPVVFGSSFDKYDVVFTDELQDLSGIQHEMVSRMLSVTSRFIGVGDSGQAIYRFRGAAADSMARAAERFRCRHLPLSISYRCPKAVVRQAQTWVKHIEAAEGAMEGMVVEYPVHTIDCSMVNHNKGGEPCTDDRESLPVSAGASAPACTCGGLHGGWLLKDFRPTDVLLCRLTRPLVETAFKLIRGRIPCRVLGRDIGQGLVALVNKSKLGPDAPVNKFDQWLTNYEEREADKLRSKEEFAKLGLLQDKIATVRVFMDDLDGLETDSQGRPVPGGHTSTIRELIQEIESLFKDDGGYGKVTLSTIHKSKGLEYKRVFILDAHLYQPCKWSNDLQQEENLMYVAATRAQEALFYIKTEAIR